MYLAGDRIIFSSFSFSKIASFYFFGRLRSFMRRENTIPFSKYELPIHVFSSFNRGVYSYTVLKVLKHLDMVYCFSLCLFPHPYPIMLTHPFPSSCPGINTLIVMAVKYCQPTVFTLMTNLLTNAMEQNHS